MATPPVCRIMDYGKFRYEESQKAKESRKKTIQVSIKEVKFKPKIGKGDFDTKVRHLRDFLEDGHKVKVTLQFRGREMAHPELGSKILDAVIVELGPAAKVEAYARLEGRNMTMVLAPEKKVVKKAEPKPAKQADDSGDTGSSDTGSSDTGPDETPVVSSPDDSEPTTDVEASDSTAPEPAASEPTAPEPGPDATTAAVTDTETDTPA